MWNLRYKYGRYRGYYIGYSGKDSKKIAEYINQLEKNKALDQVHEKVRANMDKSNGKGKKKKVAIIIGCIFLVLCALICLGIFCIFHYLDKIQRVDPESISIVAPDAEDFETDTSLDAGDFEADTSPDASESEETNLNIVDPASIEWDYIEEIGDDKLINILLVGQDRLEGQGRQRSDSMILCSINPDTLQVSLISFLRDLYVQIPGGYSDNRLNAAYAFGGFQLLDDTLYENFGITIDGNIEVDFNGFKTVIDILGGVDISLTAAEVEYLNQFSAFKDANATVGINHLNGAQALYYARIRKIDSDFYRTSRQRKILKAIYDKMKDSDMLELLSLMDTILPTLTTDMTNGEILSLLAVMYPALSSLEIESYYVPSDDAYYYASIRGMSVLVPDLKLIRSYLQNEYLPLQQ